MPDRHDVVGLPDEAVRIVRWQRRFVVLALSLIAFFTLAVAVLALVSFLRVNEQGDDIKHLIAEATEAGRERQAEQLADRERSAEAVAGALGHIEEIITVATDRNDARAHERYLDLVARLNTPCGPGTTPPPVPRHFAPPRGTPPPAPASPRVAPRAPAQSPAVRPPPPPPAPNVVEPVPGQEERQGPNSEKGKGKGPPPGKGKP